MIPSFGIYIHWPFCLSKCPYCDFNSHVRESIDTTLWKKALLKDLASFLPDTRHQTVTSIFFGGGTPSLMPPTLVESLINFVRENWSVSSHMEITLEANPNSVEINKFKDFSTAGINRLSLGIQSLNQDALSFLKRGHTAHEAHRAIDIARQVFPQYSFDLIYGRPLQSLEAWEEELQQALGLVGGHLSLYQLTIEEGTPFYLAYHRGDFTIPSEEESADLYEHTTAIMQTSGYDAYEISNYARRGQECRHNLTYWLYDDYIGVGPGAHSRVTNSTGQKIAMRRHRSPEKWLENPQTYECITLSEKETFQEILMMGLRLKKGVMMKLFQTYCSKAYEKHITHHKLHQLLQEGLIQKSPKYLALTTKGRLRLNAVWRYLTELA